MELEWTSTKNIKANVLGKIIERQIPHKVPDIERAYHALTKDLIMNELFRRVEPRGRTMGEYFSEEL